MENLYNFKELEQKALMGTPLSEGEACALEEHLTTSLMSGRSFDFGEIEGKLGAGFEGAALMERNREWAKRGPQEPAPKSFSEVCDHSPQSIIPCGPLYEGKRGIDRMLSKFFTKLAEVRETGRLVL